MDWRLMAGIASAWLTIAACGGKTANEQLSQDGGSSGAGVDGSASSGGGSGGSSGGSSGGGSGGSSGGGIDSGILLDAAGDLDASQPSLDATLAGLDAAPLGLAGFAFIINDVVRSPMVCSSENWEFVPFPTGADAACNPDPNHPGCPGVTSVYVVNTGNVQVAYYATDSWSGGYVPGVPTGATPELAGVLSPGAYVDITSVFSGGITALLGSAEPFSPQDAGQYAFDEGTIPWPVGVPGSGGAPNMHVAQIDVEAVCVKPFQQW